ncbi:hypothetical protein GP486_005351 [Trichoglossum hirsutum]|uniref:Transmembrane protein n=1 Tax=Trichoglossum hirsutum TaxID=265104 RepID=A0A9P8L9K8_9PEZI|nr:hypothetical protein GP486_005351 [Trichoglossum hirsutum]
MAVWKTTLSATLTFMGIHCWHIIRNDNKGERKWSGKLARTLVWTILYALGTVIGSVGLLSLVAKTFSRSRNIKIITGVFVGVLAIGVIFGAVLVAVGVFAISTNDKGPKSESTHPGTAGTTMSDSKDQAVSKARKESILAALGASIPIFILGFEILVAFYSDFVLAAIAENWSGTPSKGVRNVVDAFMHQTMLKWKDDKHKALTGYERKGHLKKKSKSILFKKRKEQVEEEEAEEEEVEEGEVEVQDTEWEIEALYPAEAPEGAEGETDSD